MNRLITITTDFGDQFAVAQLKAVIAALGFKGQVIENHDVKPFSVIEGAYGIWQLAKFCPKGTIHVGIVDPGVGSERAGVIIRTKNSWLVGPDNGLLWPTCQQAGRLQLRRLDEKRFGEVSSTFHGRDIFIKAAVLLAQGQTPDGIGCKRIKHVERLEFQGGQILHIDSYGNAKVWGKETFGLPVVKTFSDVAEGKPLILKGSSGTLELAVNLGNAAKQFNIKVGDVLENL